LKNTSQNSVVYAKLEDLSIEDLEAKMKKIYEDNKVLIEGEYTVGKEE
jgi:hypothetical protein